MPRTYPRKNASYSVTAAQADSILVSAVPGKRIRVLGLAISSGSVASTSLGHYIFRSIGSATSAISSSLYVGSNGFLFPVTPNHEDGWMETAMGDALYFDATSTSAGIQVVYVEV